MEYQAYDTTGLLAVEKKLKHVTILVQKRKGPNVKFHLNIVASYQTSRKNLVSTLYLYKYNNSPILEFTEYDGSITYLGLLGGLEINLLYLTYGLGLYVDTGFSSFV